MRTICKTTVSLVISGTRYYIHKRWATCLNNCRWYKQEKSFLCYEHFFSTFSALVALQWSLHTFEIVYEMHEENPQESALLQPLSYARTRFTTYMKITQTRLEHSQSNTHYRHARKHARRERFFFNGCWGTNDVLSAWDLSVYWWCPTIANARFASWSCARMLYGMLMVWYMMCDIM